jgi:fatty-acyl-CoA synthase
MTALARSYTNGISATPLLHQTIGETLDLAAERWSDQEAVVVRDRNVRLSFAELRRQADRVAAGFVALGLKQGERIGIWSPNRIEWILTQFAAAKAGLILVNINPAYRLAELEYALNKVQCRGLVTTGSEQVTISECSRPWHRNSTIAHQVHCVPNVCRI